LRVGACNSRQPTADSRQPTANSQQPTNIEKRVMSQLKQYYEKEVVPSLIETFKYKNIMEVPKIEKIVLNMGLGEAIHNIKLIDSAVEELTIIAGQRPVVTRARRSIAAFKLRAGMPIGCMVTLRRNRMYDFYQKLVNIALARVRDFRGVSGKAFDGQGNYSLGIKEHIIFPEIDYDKIDKIKGLNISIVTTAKTDEEGKTLLKLLGMPFRN
jgi:large subunit ribosomal protein L5